MKTLLPILLMVAVALTNCAKKKSASSTDEGKSKAEKLEIPSVSLKCDGNPCLGTEGK